MNETVAISEETIIRKKRTVKINRAGERKALCYVENEMAAQRKCLGEESGSLAIVIGVKWRGGEMKAKAIERRRITIVESRLINVSDMKKMKILKYRRKK
jgi:hypothetical protein